MTFNFRASTQATILYMGFKIALLILLPYFPGTNGLTHWGRMTHICVSNLTIIGSDNGLSPGRRQAIIWTNVGILLIGPLGTNFSEILIAIHKFSFKKMHLKKSSGKLRPFCLGLNVLTNNKGRTEEVGNPSVPFPARNMYEQSYNSEWYEQEWFQ